MVLLLIGLILFGAVAPASAGEAEETVRVYTNEDLPPPAPESHDVPTVAPGAAVPPLRYDTFRDRNGNDEAWWRERVAELDAEIREARLDLDLLYDLLPQCAPLHGFYWLCGREQAWQVWLEYEKAAIRLDELGAMREALNEEARIAGALPGWLR